MQLLGSLSLLLVLIIVIFNNLWHSVEVGGGKMGAGGQKVRTDSYKTIKSWGCNVQMVIVVTNTVLHI